MPDYSPPPRRPTLGKTAPNRLRRLDGFLAATEWPLLRAAGPSIAVDLGYGALPNTTLEWAARLHAINPRLEVWGVERDRERVAVALPHAGPGVAFRLGGFRLAELGRPVRLVRAMNVLRQYPADAVAPAHRAMAEALIDGGLLVEGSCDPTGRVLVAELLRRRDGALQAEGVLFAAPPRLLAAPDRFAPELPKRYIHHMAQPGPLARWFAAWRTASARSLGTRSLGVPSQLVSLFRELAGTGAIDPRFRLFRRGWLVWRGLASDPEPLA